MTVIAEQAIFALAAAVEAKDALTEQHAHRVASSARQFGRRLGLSDADVDALYYGGLIHDIGKIGVSEAILTKSGPLDLDEVERMRAHTVIGESIVAPISSGSSLPPIIRHHHERFDGHGYPDGLRGAGIPLLARIISVCDAYDALVNDRPYRTRVSVSDAVAILRDGAGGQWDPELVELFADAIPAMFDEAGATLECLTA
jgi:putative two-component system response regulator